MLGKHFNSDGSRDVFHSDAIAVILQIMFVRGFTMPDYKRVVSCVPCSLVSSRAIIEPLRYSARSGSALRYPPP